jgi:hypothetical protein
VQYRLSKFIFDLKSHSRLRRRMLGRPLVSGDGGCGLLYGAAVRAVRCGAGGRLCDSQIRCLPGQSGERQTGTPRPTGRMIRDIRRAAGTAGKTQLGSRKFTARRSSTRGQRGKQRHCSQNRQTNGIHRCVPGCRHGPAVKIPRILQSTTRNDACSSVSLMGHIGASAPSCHEAVGKFYTGDEAPPSAGSGPPLGRQRWPAGSRPRS